MYLFDRRFNDADMKRGVLRRNADLMARVAPRFLWPGEKLTCHFDTDGLGVWIGAWDTTRPETVLRCVQKEAFRNFALLGIHFDGKVYCTHIRAI